jgi:hypothetical protein
MTTIEVKRQVSVLQTLKPYVNPAPFLFSRIYQLHLTLIALYLQIGLWWKCRHRKQCLYPPHRPYKSAHPALWTKKSHGKH